VAQTFKGHTGQIEVDDDVVRFNREGVLSFVAHPVEIHLQQVAAVEFSEANAFKNGFLAIVPYGHQPLAGVLANTRNPYAIVFTNAQQEAFLMLKARLERDLRDIRRSGKDAPPLAWSDRTMQKATARPTNSYAAQMPSANPEGKKLETFHAWYALGWAVIVLILFDLFVEPWLAKSLGFSVPWWGYLLLFLFFAGHLFGQLTQQQAAKNVAYGEVQQRPSPTATKGAAFCPQCGEALQTGPFCAGCGAKAR
jgi:hypothetical protein